MKITANPTLYSSVVGAGIMLHDETGAVIGQLGILGVAGGRAEQEAMRDRLAAAINAGQPEGQVRHFKKPDVAYDVVATEALFQVSTMSSVLSGLAGSEKSRVVRDQQPVTVYRNPDGKHFVRFPDEMDEPRFEKV